VERFPKPIGEEEKIRFYMDPGGRKLKRENAAQLETSQTQFDK
jgi:hypothetical protein